jgi:VanZ family protein
MRSVFLERPTASSLGHLHGIKRFLVFWGPAILGVAVIVTESTSTFSAHNTSSWLRPIFERFLGPMSTPVWEEFHHLLRKSGHFTGYGILCVLFLRAWLLTLATDLRLATRAWRMRSWIFAVLSTAVVAGADEWHQTFLPSRTGMFSDAVLDTCGGIIVSGLCIGLSGWLRRSLDRKDQEQQQVEVRG